MALLLCLCLICSHVVSAVYAAGMDGALTDSLEDRNIPKSAEEGQAPSEKTGSEKDVPEAAGDSSDDQEGAENKAEAPEKDEHKDGTTAPADRDSSGAGTVMVGENATKMEGAAGTGKTDQVSGEYRLYITHVLTVDGHLFADEYVEVNGGLTEEVLSGGYNVLQNAYHRPGVAVTTKKLTVTKADFRDKACYAQIDYRVADGYKATYTLPGASFYSVYEGSFDRVKLERLETADTVEVKLEYRFHKRA